MLMSRLIQQALTPLLVLIFMDSTAQTGHWRLGLQVGTATVRSEFSTIPSIPNNQLVVSTPVGLWWQANLERSVAAHWSVKLAAGQITLPYTIAATTSLVDASGRVVGTTSSLFKRADHLTYTSFGLTANSPAWGPLILTAGLDITLRYNRDAGSRQPYGGWSESTLVNGPDTLRSVQFTSFTPESKPTLTVALSPRLGMDIRVSKRAFLSASATYNVGFGSVHHASFTSDLNGQPYRGTFRHDGSFLGYQAGVKYTIGQAKLLSTLPYTAYNRPVAKVAWYKDEQWQTFRKGYWLISGRVAYSSERSSNGFDLGAQVQGGYFVADQLAVGLKGKYSRDYRSSTFPITRSWLLGPVIRYHLTRSRIAPFVEGAYQLGRVHFDATATPVAYPRIQETVHVFSLSGGVSARLSQTLRLDIVAETQQFSYYPTPRRTRIRPEVGITYYLRP